MLKEETQTSHLQSHSFYCPHSNLVQQIHELLTQDVQCQTDLNAFRKELKMLKI